MNKVPPGRLAEMNTRTFARLMELAEKCPFVVAYAQSIHIEGGIARVVIDNQGKDGNWPELAKQHPEYQWWKLWNLRGDGYDYHCVICGVMVTIKDAEMNDNEQTMQA